MNVPASPETVLTEQYWEPVPPIKDFRANSVAGRLIEISLKERIGLGPTFDSQSKAIAVEAMTMAVNGLLKGSGTESIAVGEVIGGEDDIEYALPGAVLLIDREMGYINGVSDRSVSKPMESEAEISGSAASVLLRSMTGTNFPEPSDNYRILNPYYRDFTIKNVGRYVRDIQLFAFIPSKKGSVEGAGMMQWRDEPGNPSVALMTGRVLGDWFDQQGVPVGQTQNNTLAEQYPSYSRIRSAEICIAGTRAFAREKAKQPRRALLPKLAGIPGLA